jgi:hypothetical protein
VVEEGVVNVAPYYETRVELLPQTTRGRLRGRHRLAFDNLGNTAVDATLLAEEPGNGLAFRFSPPSLRAAPGTAAFASVRARPRHRLLRGQPRTHQFGVLVETEGRPAGVVHGAYLQEPLVPRWLLPALLVLAVLAIAWFALLRPTLDVAAKKAVKQQLQGHGDPAARRTAEQALAAATKAAQDAAAAAAAAKQAEAAALNAAQGNKAAAAQIAALQKQLTALQQGLAAATSQLAAATARMQRAERQNPFSGTPVSKVLSVTCDPGKTCTATFTTDAKQQLAITDWRLRNPQNDSGEVTFGFASTDMDVERLETFYSLENHDQSPAIVGPGQTVRLTITCRNGQPGSTGPKGPCKDSVYLAGFAKQAAAMGSR